MIARLKAARGDNDAEDWYLKGISREPGNYWIRLDYANFLARDGQYDLALQTFDEAISLAPGYAVGYFEKGNTLYEMGEYEAAYEAYTKASEVEPGWYAMFGGGQ
jgi:tetratricopeptide (TPR) repeat protein